MSGINQLSSKAIAFATPFADDVMHVTTISAIPAGWAVPPNLKLLRKITFGFAPQRLHPLVLGDQGQDSARRHSAKELGLCLTIRIRPCLL